MEALGEWGTLHEVVEHKYNLLTEDNRQKACRLAAASAFGLHNWESMEEHMKFIPQDSQDGAFYRAILAIHKEQVIGYYCLITMKPKIISNFHYYNLTIKLII